MEQHSELKIVYRGLSFLAADLEDSGEKLELRRIAATQNRRGQTTLYMFPDAGDFVEIANGMVNHVDLAANAWLVFVENSTDFDKLGNAALKHLTLESMLYVHKEGILQEWYKIGQSDYIVKQEYAKFDENGEMELIGSAYIWDRRADLRGCVFRTVYVDNQPYVYKHEDENGTEITTGLFYELAKTMSTSLNFTMELIETEMYGELLDNGTWVGIVGMLNRSEADLTINDFSITEARSRVRLLI